MIRLRRWFGYRLASEECLIPSSVSRQQRGSSALEKFSFQVEPLKSALANLSTALLNLATPLFNFISCVEKFKSGVEKSSSRHSKLESPHSKLESRHSKLESPHSNIESRLSNIESPHSKLESRHSKLPNRHDKFAITLLNTLIINQLSASRAKATLCKPSAGALQGEREGGVGKWGSGEAGEDADWELMRNGRTGCVSH